MLRARIASRGRLRAGCQVLRSLEMEPLRARIRMCGCRGNFRPLLGKSVCFATVAPLRCGAWGVLWDGRAVGRICTALLVW